MRKMEQKRVKVHDIIRELNLQMDEHSDYRTIYYNENIEIRAI
jgi:hypothetical protein